jgi:hypothetical protein
MTAQPEECKATRYAANDDGEVRCDLTAGHLGQHWDPEYGVLFN